MADHRLDVEAEGQRHGTLLVLCGLIDDSICEVVVEVGSRTQPAGGVVQR
jgi:hypothetical protein